MWGAVAAVHVLWLLTFPTAVGKLVAAAGAASAILLSACAGHSSGSASARPQATAVVGVFLLPSLAWLHAPRVAFFTLDGPAWLVLAWLAALSTCVLTARTDDERNAGQGGTAARRQTPAIVLLFVAWSASFWLAVVWDLGVGRVVFELKRDQYRACQFDPLADTFTIWEGHPASEHVFLGWRAPEQFRVRKAYVNHVHPYLFAMYGWMSTVRAAGRTDLYTASNTTPLLYLLVIAAASAALFARLGLLERAASPVRLLLIFLGMGVVVTTWRFWHDLYRYSSDNPYPLLAGMLILVYACLLEPVRPRAAAASAAALVALSPTYAPFLLVPVALLFGRSGRLWREFAARNRTLLRLAALAVVTSIVVFAVPIVLVWMKGFTPHGSSLLFRSGLDGDDRYVSSLAQAVLAPCPQACCWGRTAGDLLLPAFLPLALLWPLVARAARVSGPDLHLGRQLLFLLTPYLLSVIVFPQSVSVHPYMYDHLLIIPVVVTGVTALLHPALQQRLGGAALLALLLGLAAVLMSNLLTLAQALSRMRVI